MRRLVGVGVLVALGLTFAALGLLPPRTAGAASLYLGAIVGEVAVLLLLPVVDMWATARMVKMVKAARARRSATGRGASDPRTGSSPDRPR